MLVEHLPSLYQRWCVGVEGCAIMHRRSWNLLMLVEHPLSLYWCAGVEGCAAVSHNQLSDIPQYHSYNPSNLYDLIVDTVTITRNKPAWDGMKRLDQGI
jgi:hypothetical protein